MEVTFVANARILGYKPGQIIKTEMTRQLHALLSIGRHLTLIDPPTLAEVYGGTTQLPASMAFESAPAPAPAHAEDDEDGGTESPSDPEKRGSFSFSNYRQPTTSSSGERKS